MLQIVVDTREQEAYTFIEPTVRKKLAAGDYSIETMEDQVAVERKTLNDFVHTVIHERERFSRELKILQTYPRACVVVEASLGDLLTSTYRSRAHPNSVFGATMSIIVDYGVPVYFCTSRQIACRFVTEFLLRSQQMEIDSCKAQLPFHIPVSGDMSSTSSSLPPASARGGS